MLSIWEPVYIAQIVHKNVSDIWNIFNLVPKQRFSAASHYGEFSRVYITLLFFRSKLLFDSQSAWNSAPESIIRDGGYKGAIVPERGRLLKRSCSEILQHYRIVLGG